jgi:apolipoprotein D and lipocalin family protein
MNQMSNSPAHAPNKSSISSLDQQIRDAELRLISREEDLHHRLKNINQQVTQTLKRPRDYVPTAIGAVIGGVVLLWGLKRLLSKSKKSAAAQASVSQQRPYQAQSQSFLGGVPWLRLMGLAWPLLPQQWRTRVNPAMASTVMSVVIPWLERGVMHFRSPSRKAAAPHSVNGHNFAGPQSFQDSSALQSVPRVDLSRYAGLWFEVARLGAPFERLCVQQPTARYTLVRGARETQLQVVNRCGDRKGRVREAVGLARTEAGLGGGRLKISFLPSALRWLPGAWSDYWILDLDSSYSTALVGHPNRKSLWILSRQPQISDDRLREMVEKAHQLGYPVERFFFSEF